MGGFVIFPIRHPLVTAMLFIFVIGISRSQARIIHVPTDEPSIKAAIVVAETTDTVMVSPGIYTGHNNIDIDLSKKAITVMSLKGSSATVIDCQATRENPHRGFYVRQGEDPRTVIQGFTVINGFAPFDQGGQSLGGGILCTNTSSPTVTDCVFQFSAAAHAGGGMYCGEGSRPIVSGCVFDGNTVIDDQNSGIIGYGGGVRCNVSEATFFNCVFSSNHANYGGGMSCTASDITLLGCDFRHNIADVVVTLEPSFPGLGGGLHLMQSSPTITGCTFDGNTAVQGMNMGMQNAIGGGLYAFQSTPDFEQCSFYGNTAEKYGEQVPGLGAGLAFIASPISMHTCLVAFNNGGEAIYRDTVDTPAPIAISCCDLYANELGDWIGPIAGLLGQDGNISDDPLFCDTADGNLELRGPSPCAAVNNSCGETIGAFEIGCDTGVDDDAATGATAIIDLNQNYPNPFNRGTVISYTLPRQSRVRLTIYNVAGQSVRRLVEGIRTAGVHRISWDGRDELGREVASGIYLYRLQTEAAVMSRKMILMK